MSHIYDRTSNANTFVLHGLKKSEVKGKELFLFAEEWMKKNNFVPDKLNGKSSKNITFLRGKKALEKDDFEYVRQKGFWMASLQSDEFVTLETVDYKACIYLRASKQESKRNFLMISWEDSLVNWDDDFIIKLVQELTDYVKSTYGYAFQRPFAFGPTYYASGTVFGLDINEQVESKQIANWHWSGILNGRLSQPYFIRDVYRLNFLSKVHLDAPVGKSTLENWIKENQTRGNLEKITSTLWCWSVDVDQVDKIRQELIPHKILAAFVDY